MARVALTLTATLLCGLCLMTASASGAPAEYAGSSADGTKVFFTTAAKLVPGDTDNGFVDVYERFYDGAPGIETYVTREISTGPTGGNDSHDVTFDGVSSDGTKVFFSTAESLVAEDKDKSRDVYERNTTTGETILISGGPASCAPCGNREVPATFLGATADGSKVYFSTEESLVAGDEDQASDIYVRDPAQPEAALASPGGSAPVTFDGASADGNEVVFETADQLAPGDGDAETDIYERNLSAGTTKLVSLTGTCPAPLSVGECAPIYRATAADGAVVFQTRAQVSPADHDKFQDVYDWSSSTGADLVSTSGEAEAGNGEYNAVYAGMAGGGSIVYFETDERLATADAGEQNDVYARSGSSTTLVSQGDATFPAFFDRASADGSTVLFSTRQALAAGDSGEKLDVYEREAGGIDLVSPGSPEFDATFAGASSDAATVFYSTAEQVAAADLDSLPDIYERAGGGSPTLVSVGPAGGNGSFVPHLTAVSSDGAHAFLITRERLTVDDNFASENDVYDRSSGGILLVSVGNSAEVQLGPPAPRLTATAPGSPNPSTEPRIIGEAELGTLVKVYPTVDCFGAPAAVGSAAEFLGAGIAVTVKAGSTTEFHATATNTSGDTSACSTNSVAYTQQATPPPSDGGGGSPEGGSSGGTGASGGSSPPPSRPGSTPTGPASVPAQVRIGDVVYVAPQTRITFAPASKTRFRTPVFRFVDATGQGGTKFVCRIDHQPWKGCGSPFKSKPLKLGKHLFSVKGVSFAGQWEAVAINRGFKVVAR